MTAACVAIVTSSVTIQHVYRYESLSNTAALPFTNVPPCRNYVTCLFYCLYCTSLSGIGSSDSEHGTVNSITLYNLFL